MARLLASPFEHLIWDPLKLLGKGAAAPVKGLVWLAKGTEVKPSDHPTYSDSMKQEVLEAMAKASQCPCKFCVEQREHEAFVTAMKNHHKSS